ncbi:hypothetical protein K8O93_12300 [Gordonia bronchialis]|uniref:hypothetical protein n=1 Tax=Gordonia bronchialis TaxID=2054 RepID=UPI001CC00123|nr:hypothetical protein [Gordonia bronchialis]UAK40311.1 hypothetical protein K8O93_12300 [Gordonia bronchialis]
MKRIAALLIVVTAVLTGSIIGTGTGLMLFNVNTFAINNPVRVLQGYGSGAYLLVP